MTRTKDKFNEFYALVQDEALCLDEGGEPFISKNKTSKELTSFFDYYPDAEIKKVKIEVLK